MFWQSRGDLSVLSFFFFLRKGDGAEAYLCLRTSGVHAVVVIHAAGFGESGEQAANWV